MAIALERYGFHVVDAMRLPMHGGSLQVTASKKRPDRVADGALQVRDYERRMSLDNVDTWHRFAARLRRKIDIAAKVYGALSKNQTIWAYGAAGKATMWVNIYSMTYLGAVVDASP